MISKKEAKEKTLRSIAPDFLNRLEHKIQEEANKRHFEKSDGFKKVLNQLEAYFDGEFGEVYRALQRHEISYIVS